VTDNQNTTNRRSIAISATSAPSQLVVSASANPNSGQAPLTVNFTGSGTGGTPPYSYSWNFGDDSTSTAQNPSHAYTATGNFTATLTVTDKNSTNATATVNITVSVTITSYNLLLSSETGAPAPGQGGTTDPSPGNHSYSIGSTVQIEAIPHLDYRFANWSGDANTAKLYDQKIPILMDGNKSIVAHFCTRCGDVNGNLAITPGDAQEAFEIYLGRISNPTECQRENADVNCDGTKSHPNITPADAQAIFKIYLGSIGFPCDCSGKSRAENIVSQIRKTSGIRLILNDIQGQRDREIVVPVLIDSRTKINSFGFDLIYPSETLEFIRTEGIGLSKDFEQVGVNHIANGALRVGGYNIVKKTGLLSGILLTLVFRVIGDINNPRLLSIINTVDDLKNATVQTGMLLKKKDIPKKRDNMDKRIHPGHNYQENS
jgi:PKD repeat protein